MTAILLETGEVVQILCGIDADPSALVWIAFPGTDRDAFVTRAQIEVI